jgi:superfamily I DNA and/or RNA helicase
VDDHFDRFLDLIEAEREAEKEENKKALDRWPVEMREALGKTVTRLSVTKEDVGVGGIPLIVVGRPPEGEELSPFHAMDQGDLVRVRFATGRSADGTLYDVDEYAAVVALNEPLPEPAKGRCQIDLLGSDATYQRMRKALESVRHAGGRTGTLRDVLLGRRPAARQDPGPVEFLNAALNEGQRHAVRTALAARDAAVVHGPPGTGKTTVLVEIIRQAVRRGERVLASAPSNVAVDNLLEKLLDRGVRVVRLGHPARTLESLRHATLAAQAADHADQRLLRDLVQERLRLETQRERRNDRGGGLSREEDREIHKSIQALWREIRQIEKALSRGILRAAQVVLATHGGLGRIVQGERFDLAVLDEASQATEPLSWIPIAQADRVVLAGDPLQLPPTVYSEKAVGAGLRFTLMERLQGLLPPEFQALLRVQYRMNETIMGFSSERFYEGRLEAHESVRAHLASGLPGVADTPLTREPLTFIDTAGSGFEETWNELMDSRENDGEAALALRIWRELEAAGVPREATAIITPYAAQSKRLRVKAPRGLEVGTVDGFQGREKEAVIVSLVRSNPKGEVGFLSDTRRMNVAMTRARRLLVVIGDSATIARHPFYEAFLAYAEKHGCHRSSWEWADGAVEETPPAP